MALVLASASPRRRELLERIGVAIEIAPADVDESAWPNEAPLCFAARMAKEKAEACAAGFADRWVLGADTIVVVDEQILGKPSDRGDAQAMLGVLLGRTHEVTTAVCLVGPNGGNSLAVTTAVTMRDASESELAAYLDCGEWRGKAGGYAIQGVAGALVSQIRGSVTNVIGLPLAEVATLLSVCGAPAPDFRRGHPA